MLFYTTARKLALLVACLIPAFALAAVSSDGTCAGANGYTCQGSNFGSSCSKNNQCGRDASYYKLSQGCQPAHGYCTPKGSVSPDGSCGGSDMFTCSGSQYGDSCGPNNLCGRDAGYSGNGCQQQYGYCATCTTAAIPSTSRTTKTVTKTVTSLISSSTTVTVSSGVVTTSATITTTSVSTAATVTAFTTSTISPPAASAVTITVTITTQPPAVTITVAQTTTGLNLNKRALDAMPTQDLMWVTVTGRALRATSSNASCGTITSTGSTTRTTTLTSTVTSTSRTTTVSSSFTTVPASTTTVTSISTVTVFATAATTVTSTISLAIVTPTITVTAQTTGTASTVTVTGSRTVVATFSQATQSINSGNCGPNGSGFYDYLGIYESSANNYQAGRAACAQYCANSAQCQSYLFGAYSPPSGPDEQDCYLFDKPYSSSFISCGSNVRYIYFAGYNLVAKE